MINRFALIAVGVLLIVAMPSLGAPALYNGSGTGSTTSTNTGCAQSDPVCVDPSVRVVRGKAGFDENGCFYINAAINVRAEVKVLNTTHVVNRTVGVNRTICDVPPIVMPDTDKPCSILEYMEFASVADASTYSMDYNFVLLTTAAPSTWDGDAYINYRGADGAHLAFMHMKCPRTALVMQS